jgi:hypothetical protein
MRTGDVVRARGFFETAVRGDPRPEYQASLALTFVVDAQRRDLSRAKALLAEATRDPACDRAFYAAGMLARVEGDAKAAEQMFRRAVEANPRNQEAARELRTLQSRRSVHRD